MLRGKGGGNYTAQHRRDFQEPATVILEPQIGERPILQDEPFNSSQATSLAQLPPRITIESKCIMHSKVISRKRAVKHLDLPNDGGNLSDYGISERKQSTWTSNRRYAADIAFKLSEGASGRNFKEQEMLERHADRMRECAQFVSLRADEIATGEGFKMSVHGLHTCKVRSCPFCQYAKQERRKLDFMPVIPKVMERYPNGRWVFLTLTVRNPLVEDTGATLAEMTKAWSRFTQRPEMQRVIGWVRMMEITLPKREGANGQEVPILTHSHPHYHVLMFVPSSWFKRDYVKQARWQEIWSECIQDSNLKGDDGQAQIDIRAVKPKGESTGDIGQDMHAAVSETFKYAIKGSDLVLSTKWTAEIAVQTNRKRNIAFGGLIKELIRESKESDATLIEALNADDGESGTVKAERVAELKAGTVIIGFRWDAMQRRYVRDESRDAVGAITAQMQDDITAMEAGGVDASFASVDWTREDLAALLAGKSPEMQRIIKARIIDDMLDRGELLPAEANGSQTEVGTGKDTQQEPAGRNQTARELDLERSISLEAKLRNHAAAEERNDNIRKTLRLAKGDKR